MPNFAIVENGKVTNIVVAELDYAAEKGWIAMPSGVEIDWDYIDGQFVNNRPIIPFVAPPAPTKEELMAELAALTARIQSLGV